MITIFRKIREKTLIENKFSKYLIYAIGEIILVVIGILIALSVNNWNESNNLSKKELSQLTKLKNDVDSDIEYLNKEDSRYEKFEAASKISIDLFYKAENIKDLDSIYIMSSSLWNELYINQNSYNEMINSGSMYLIKNKELQKTITEYYIAVEANRMYLREVNKTQNHLWNINSDIYPYKFLVSLPENHKVDFGLIDTSWIGNPNSPSYLAVLSFLESNYGTNNVYRRFVYQRILEKADVLTKAIQEELKSRNK